ncbi:MbtH family protein [Nocardia rhamnosiphila]|uniref:MbtH family protein n=1 Tax=Nocardia rhamnosiphila TaxID=426716 RepID=UPI003F4D2BD3
MNPFDDENSQFVVLMNNEGQYSLWPAVHEVPQGWTVVRTSASREVCIAYIENEWTDMRPNSARKAILN